MSSGFVRDENDALQQIFATPVHVTSSDGAALAATAHTLQCRIDKAFDVRITTIGAQHFAVAVHSTSTAGRTDWRSDYGSLDYQPVEIPAEVASALDRYLAQLGLVYAASDFTLDQNGKWWFLECNPNGQWGFIAAATELPIAATIADLLIAGVAA